MEAFLVNRIPGFGLLTRQNQELWSSGDRRARAEVLGRQALGFAGTMYALDVALEYVETKDGMRLPKLTGNGPANFDIKNNGYLLDGNLIPLQNKIQMEQLLIFNITEWILVFMF